MSVRVLWKKTGLVPHHAIQRLDGLRTVSPVSGGWGKPAVAVLVRVRAVEAATSTRIELQEQEHHQVPVPSFLKVVARVQIGRVSVREVLNRFAHQYCTSGEAPENKWSYGHDNEDNSVFNSIGVFGD